MYRILFIEEGRYVRIGNGLPLQGKSREELLSKLRDGYEILREDGTEFDASEYLELFEIVEVNNEI